ncbi:hypothetical protein QR680_007466 [Steinernema hermaphroditum]|uniref:Uncharacterized protein n=1 Tax=Steinernema hermaphroditum TaxID=289476 RepID=A0AA39ID89_9BILA|nr:hypothetical protein QR680_007466 [Steinernema hermaphroditum]
MDEFIFPSDFITTTNDIFVYWCLIKIHKLDNPPRDVDDDSSSSPLQRKLMLNNMLRCHIESKDESYVMPLTMDVPRNDERVSEALEEHVYNMLCLTGKSVEKFPETNCVVACYVTMSCCLVLISQLTMHPIIMLAIAVFGCASGLSQSAINIGFLRLFAKEHSSFVYILYASYALGVLAPSFFFEVGPPATDCIEMFPSSSNSTKGQIKTVTPHLRSKLPSQHVISLAAVFELLLIYAYFNSAKQNIETEDDPDPREEYEDIDQGHHKDKSTDRNVMSILILVTVTSCVANSLFVVFPYYLSSYSISVENITKSRLFVGGFVIGRLLAFAASLKIAPYFILAVSIIGCGMAICCLSIDPLNLFGCTLFGLFLSPILPTFIPYLRYYLKLNVSTVHVVITGAAFGALLYPLVVAQMIHQFGNRVFIGVNFFSVLLLVILFVGVLNIQSQMEKNQGIRRIKIQRFRAPTVKNKDEYKVIEEQSTQFEPEDENL